MTADYEKLRQEEAEKSAKLQELMSVPLYPISTTIQTTNQPQQINNLTPKKSPTHDHFDFGNLRRSGATHCRRPSLAAAVVDDVDQPTTGHDSNREQQQQQQQLDRDEQNLQFQRRLKLSKLHKNLLNCRNKVGGGSAINDYRQLIEELEREERERDETAANGGNKTKGKSLISCLASTIPMALPTLQLHLLLSLTMVLLTHRCPQYLIIL